MSEAEESMGRYFAEIYGAPSPSRFRNFRKNNKTHWMKKDGSIIAIKDMETEHIKFCINILETMKQTETLAYKGLTEELNKRRNK